MRIAQLSDLHLCAARDAQVHGWPVERSWHQVLELALASKPDALLLSGDLSQDGSRAAYARLRDSLAGFDGPVWAIPGNHDNPENLRALLGPVCRLDSASCGTWSILLLSSWQAGQVSGRLSAHERHRLLDWLARLSGPGLIAVHHPPLPLGSAWLDAIGLEQPEELLEPLHAHPTPLVLVYGHAHQDHASRLGRHLLLACPATCRPFQPSSEQFTIDTVAPGFRLLDLAPDGAVSSQIVRLATPTVF